MVIVILTLALFILIFICSGMKVVKEYERVIIFRRGKYYDIKGPGIIWKVPILDTIVQRVSLEEQSADIDSSETVTVDGVSYRIKGVVQWKVVDVVKYAASAKISERTVNSTIQHYVDEIMKSMTSDVVFEDANELSSRIEKELEPMFVERGLKITKIDLRAASSWE